MAPIFELDPQSVTCDFTTVTGNTTLGCTINTRDVRGELAGDFRDIKRFTHPAQSEITFVSTGIYRFNIYTKTPGQMEAWAAIAGVKIPSQTLTVTPPILHHIANFTCFPLTAVAGQDVTCHISTHSGTGEANAASDFTAVVYNSDDVSLLADAPVYNTSLGRFKGPRSIFIPGDPLLYDFPTLSPTVSYIRHGVYEFVFKTWRPGPFAAFVTYQNQPIEFPNPVIIDAAAPSVSLTTSEIVCPAIAAPHRTLACTLHLRGADYVTTGVPALAINYTSQTQVQATMSGRPLLVTSVWSGEGRFSLLMHPNSTGIIHVTAQHHGSQLSVKPATGVLVEQQYVMTCPKISALLQSVTIMQQHAKGRGDTYVYGHTATKAFFKGGSSMCDAPLV